MATEEIKQININGVTYGVQDEITRKNNVYSTEETDTGKKWIDGKTIYRRALTITPQQGAFIILQENTLPYTFITVNALTTVRYSNGPRNIIGCPAQIMTGETTVLSSMILQQDRTTGYLYLQYTGTGFTPQLLSCTLILEYAK